MADGKLTSSLQESVLTLICTNDDQGAIAAGLIDPDLFEPPLDEIITKAIGYRKRFKKAPGIEHIDDLFDDILSNPKNKRKRIFEQVLSGIIQQADGLNAEYVLSRVTEFLRRQELKAAVLQAADCYQRPGEDLAERVEGILGKALKAKATQTSPGIFLGDRNRVIRAISTPKAVSYQLGIPELDRRGLGPTAGEALAFLAPKGRGKCIAKGQLVQLADGTRKPVEHVVRDQDQWVVALDENTKRFVTARIKAYFDNGLKEVLEVKTKTGRKIACTSNHPFLTESGWKEASDLVLGRDRVAVPWKVAGLGQKSYPTHKLKLLGFLLANGGLSQDCAITFSSKDPTIKKEFAKYVRQMKDSITPANRMSDYIVSRAGRVPPNTILWLRELGLMRRKSSEKFVPEFVFNLTDNDITTFLEALFSCDLGIARDYVIYTSASSKLVLDVQTLLLRLGVAGRYNEFTAGFYGKKLPGYAELTIMSGRNLQRFVQSFRLCGKKESSRQKIKVGQLQWQHQRPLSPEAFFDPVVSITPLGVKHTYDLTIDKYHNFITNDCIVHNTWFAIDAGTKIWLQEGRVAHVSLEMSEEKILARYLQRLFAIAKRDEPFELTRFDRDELKRVTGFDRRRQQPRLAFDDPQLEKKLGKRLDQFGARLNRIVIKQFPTSQLTMGGLEAWLDQLEVNEGFIPTALILDYPKLMKLDARQERRIALGQRFEELRGLCVERNLAGVFPIQANREGETAQLLTGQHVGEDYSQLQTADIAITYNQTKFEHDLGLARLYVEKGRNDEDKFSVLITQSYTTGRFCADTAFMPNNYWQMIKGQPSEDE